MFPAAECSTFCVCSTMSQEVQERTRVAADLLKVCLEGPKELLDDTAVSQPALYVAGLAAVEKLRAEDGAAVEQCIAAAGLSLGEYCALVFAGALSFEDGLKVRRTCRSLAGSICCT